jgi:hypothetical protein
VSDPARLVAPGESGEIVLERGVAAHVLRGARPGPTVWAWAPRGHQDPSMAQALGELRDRLDPRALAGAIGLLLDGPPPPAPREQYPWAGAIRAFSSSAAAVVLCESMPAGTQAAPHVVVDLDDRASRRVARALGATYLLPHHAAPAIDRAIVSAPTAIWIDGEGERLDRAVVERAARALRSLLATLGMLDEKPLAPPVRVAVKSIVTVDAPGPALVEAAAAPGAVVRAGETIAWCGEPGLRARRPLPAPATGVVLWTRAGQLVGGPVVGIGKLKRALPAVMRAAAAPVSARTPARSVEIGWCEHVALPELGVARLPAKIDTGARTCALHVQRMQAAGQAPNGRALYDVELIDGTHGKRGRARTRSIRVEVVEWTLVRDSGGHALKRPVIETRLQLGPVERTVRVSLTDRGDMRFPMLIGRTALGAEFRVAPQRRFALDRPRPARYH